MTRLLLIDDDPALLLEQMRHLFAFRNIEIVLARSGQDGLREIAGQKPDAIMLDVILPDLSGLEVYQRLRKIDARIPVIFITAVTTAETAIEAMRQGAYEYLFKPVDLRQLDKVITDAIELGRRMRGPTMVGAPTSDIDSGGDAIIGRCPEMRNVYKAIGRVADQKVLVLITGESGTGKELVARAIYQHSQRARSPFLTINCAAIPENLLESELFGHEKGAFTNADHRRIGKFEQCNGGTIFLDEIGDMPLATQAKILRLLQDQKFERVGGNEMIHTDVRLIAATNRDLKASVQAGKFRSDLYHRISVFTIHLPPLRERGDDLNILVHFYLRRFNRELDRDVRAVHPDSMELLHRYPWPGNVRELQSVLMQSLLQGHNSVLMPQELPELPIGLEKTAAPRQREPERGFNFDAFACAQLQVGTLTLYADAHLELDRILLTRVLQFTSGNHYQAAKTLGIARQTLRKRLHELHIHVTKSVEPAPEVHE